MKMILPVANGIALMITIIVNYFSNTGLLNGNTMKIVSDKYSNLFTPAGYAFSIWGLIYLALIGFVFYTGRSLFTKKESDPFVAKIGWWFVISCLANCLWVVAWLYEYTGASVVIMVIMFLSLLKIVGNTRMELDVQPIKIYLFIFWPFALYSGWIAVALIANVAAWLTKVHWSGWGISEVTWTMVMISIAGLINIFMIRTRNLREYALVGIWGIIAIAASNVNTSIIYTCYAVAIILFIYIGISAMKNSQRSFNRM